MNVETVQEGAGGALQGELQVWLDPSLPTRPAILQWLVSQNAIISTDHTDPDTHIIILHPTSIEIFDRYCHPAWLSARQRMAYRRMLRAGGVEEWRRKVILTEMWPKLCRVQGRTLGEEDDWGGCRKGGPPRRIKQVSLLAPLETIIVQDPTHPSTSSPPGHSDRPIPPTAPPSVQTPQSEPIPDGSGEHIPLGHPGPEVQDHIVKITAFNKTSAGQSKTSDDETYTSPDTRIEITPLPADPDQPFPAIQHTHESPIRPFDEDHDGNENESPPLEERVSRLIDEDYDEGGSTREPESVPLCISGAVQVGTEERAEGTEKATQAGPSRWQHTCIPAHDAELSSTPLHTQHTSRATTVDDEGFQLGHGTLVGEGSTRTVVPDPNLPRLGLRPLEVRPIITPQRSEADSLPSARVPANRQILAKGINPNNQVSRWQTPQAPPAILEGTAFYLDNGRFGRRNTVSNIQSDISQATHALLNPVKSKDRPARVDLIQLASQANIWCVGFDWLEDSWEQGRRLPEWDYVYEGGVPANRIGETIHPLPPRPIAVPAHVTTPRNAQRISNDQLLSNDDLAMIFADAVEEHDRTGMTWVQTTANIMKKHGTYSLSHWLNLLTEYRGKTGRFANLAGEAVARLSINDLDSIFKKAHPISQKRGSSLVEVARHLAATRNEYCEAAWGNLYREWRTSTGRFANLKGGPSMSRQERLLTEYDEYSALFQPYRQMWKAGAGRDEIYRKIARENPGYKYSLAVWGRYFGNWLRGRSIKTNEELTARFDQINSPSPERSSRAILSTADLAKFFKAEYDNHAFTSAEVAERAAAKCGYAPGSLANYYGEWRRSTGRFQGIDSSLAYSGLAPSRGTVRSVSIQESPSTTKKSLEAASSRSSPTKKVKNSYTDAEEAKMAVYITSRLPTPTEPRSADWELFANENPARTHAAWVEHYRQYRARINDLVTKLGGHIPGKRTPNGKRKRAGSDDSIVFVAHQDKRQRTEDVEVVDFVDSDED